MGLSKAKSMLDQCSRADFLRASDSHCAKAALSLSELSGEGLQFFAGEALDRQV
jgi:hypothetical protein